MGDSALAVRIEEGKNFPKDAFSTFRVAALFDDEPRSTPLASPSPSPFWGSTLAWEVPAERLRRLSATGTGQLKLTVLDAEGAKLGWVVLDLRSAKRNAAPGAVAQWLPLNLTWRGPRGREAPELRVHHALFSTRDLQHHLQQQEAEEEQLQQPEQRAAPASRAAPRREGGSDEGGVAKEEAGEQRDDDHAWREDDEPGDDDDDDDDEEDNAALAQQHEQRLGAHYVASQPGGGEVRLFQLRVTLQTLATRCGHRHGRLALRAHLPPALLACLLEESAGTCDHQDQQAQLAETAARPVRARPQRSILGGAETALLGGCASWTFAAGVGALAEALACGPRLVAELLLLDEEEQEEEDGEAAAVLGVATAPLAPLLHAADCDSIATLHEPLAPAAAAGDDVAAARQQPRAAVGAVRLRMELVELGDASMEARKQLLRSDHGEQGHQRALAHAVGGKRDREDGRPADQQDEEGEPDASGDDHTQPGEGDGRQPSSAPSAPPPVHIDAALRCAPEYEAAWSLEVWRCGEMASFRKQLQASAAKRMDALACAWRTREGVRCADAAARARSASELESALRGSLATVAAREEQLLKASEAAAAARESERRELQQRLAEAQHAVRTLQAECEQALTLERARVSESARAHAAAMARADASDARAAAMQAEYDAFRAAQRASPEGRAQADAAAARRERDDALAKAQQASAARERALAHVRRLAEEMASLMALRDAEKDARAVADLRAARANAAAAAADGAAAAAAADAADAARLAQELEEVGASLSARPGDDAGAVSCDENEEDPLEDGENVAPAPEPGSDGTPRDFGDAYLHGDASPRALVARVLRDGRDPEVESSRLLRERAALLGGGAYTRQDRAVRRVEACIEELWRQAERRKGIYRDEV